MQKDNVVDNESTDLSAHYDFDYGEAKPHRFAEHLEQEQLMVMLDPDIAAVFPTSEAVNEALRVLVAAAKNLPNRKQPRKQRPSSRQT
ncbi:MAG: hypothetical protein KF832_13990 [Caldilineaceae bacterium]|nr:hypothetical protein [Caldilineaceae bacterium]